MGRAVAIVLVWLAGLWAAPVQAHQTGGDDKPGLTDRQAAIAYSQKAIGRRLGDLTFVDQHERPVRLSEFRGRPLIMSAIFTACTRSCPLLMQSLANAVQVARTTLGKDGFSVATVGFDPDVDTPAQMRAYARSQGVDLADWRFLSGDHETVDALLDDLGFLYVASARGFDHVAQVSLVDADGRIVAQVYGDNFAAAAVVDPLKSMLLRRTLNLRDVAGLIDRVRLFCTFYDPRRDRYYFDYSIFIALAVGTASLSGLLFILVRGLLSGGNRPGSA